MDDATLDEFGADDGRDGDGEPPVADPGRSGRDAAVTTFSWTPDGGYCADCGTAVERRWRRRTDLVCEDCLDWG